MRLSKYLSTKRCGYAAAFALSVFLFAGCSIQKMAVDQTATVMGDGLVAFDSEEDMQFAREAFPASLKTMETFLVSSPENETLLLLLARGYASYSFAFVESEYEKAVVDGTEEEIEYHKARARKLYLRARGFGFRLLGNAELQEAALGHDIPATEKALEGLGKDAGPGLFWTAYAWGSAVQVGQDNPDLLAGLPIIERMMGRVLELGPEYYYSGAHLFFGVYYASRPPMFGGDPKKSKASFDVAMEKHGSQNLLIPLMEGLFYAKQTQDRALFDKRMQEVLNADLSEHPELRLNNEIARARARFWLGQADELFF